jgi:hypothetical protein
MAEAAEEQRLLRVQKNYIELEMRKFKRKKMCSIHDLENQLLRDVSLNIEENTQYGYNVQTIFSGIKQETATARTGSFNASTSS